MKLYTYYRKGINRWRTEIAKGTRPGDGLRHLALGRTKEEAEKLARERLEQESPDISDRFLYG